MVFLEAPHGKHLYLFGQIWVVATFASREARKVRALNWAHGCPPHNWSSVSEK